MKRAWSLSKVFGGLLIVGSIFAYVETAYDSRFYSDSFLTDANRNISSADLEIAESLQPGAGAFETSEISENDLPEEVKYQPKIQVVDMNLAPLINGEWEIVKHYELEGRVFFDRTNETARPDDFNADFSVKLSLIEKSLVMVDEVETELFNISLMTRHGTIQIFRPLGETFEIIEARKMKKATKKAVASSEEAAQEEAVKGFHVDDKTCFLKAHDPKRGNKILMGNALEGSISIYNDEISIEGVTLKHVDANGKEKSSESLTFTGMIQDNGTIFQDGIGGHVSIIGKKEVRIMFAQGPLAQATLTFGIGDRCDSAVAQLSPDKEQEFEEMMSERGGFEEDNGERLNPADELGTIEDNKDMEEVEYEEVEEDELSDEELEEEELLEEEAEEVADAGNANESNAFNF
jgi:hypothetical protein